MESVTMSPLATVQFIPVINYLNILSEFLFIENYLPEVNQYKQIPIVNALYDYLEENKNNNANIVKLIRILLKGSDLFGEEDADAFNTYFVNKMFDYIISSLVFDNYGNIYGFLINVIRGMDNLQCDHVMTAIRETLKNAKFENEYGKKSSLSELAINKIVENLINPLFPLQQTTTSLLSLDYIFAQAGLMYLQFGKVNREYFPSLIPKMKNSTEGDSFNEYLALGHIVKFLLVSGRIDPLNSRIFAFSALIHYVRTEEIGNITTRNIIFDPIHWKAAYHKFFQYITNNFDRIEEQLMDDYNYRIHLAFSNFRNIDTMNKFVLDLESRLLLINKNHEKTGIFESELVLPNVTQWTRVQIHNLGEIYERYDLEMTKTSLKEFIVDDLNNVVVTLLYSNDASLLRSGDHSPENFSYDLLEFHSILNETYEYYALIRENYSIRFIKESDDCNLRDVLNVSLKQLIKSGHRVVLKYANENSDELAEELMKIKKERFVSYLSDSNRIKKNSEWWKLFGLSLVPFYPCLINQQVCEKNNYKFLNQFKNTHVSSYLNNGKTKFLLESLGTSIRTIFLKEAIGKILDLSAKVGNDLHDRVYDQFSLHLEEPAFVDSSIRKNDVISITTVLERLATEISYKFIITDILDVMKILKIHSWKQIERIDKYGRRHRLYVNVTGYDTRQGFGYKFALNTIDGAIRYGQLRTDYDIKEKMFVQPSRKYKDTYIKLNNRTLEFDSHPFFYYNINNQLRRKSTTSVFSGIFSNNTINHFRSNGNNTNLKEITLMNAESRINSIYSYRERYNIENEINFENIINDYNEQMAYNFVSIEEFYAVRNFATTGNRRIQEDTNEAREMKNALYKLAERQSERQREESFDLKLFRLETRTIDFVNRELYKGKHIVLQKFTITSTNVASATRFNAYPSFGFRNILYEYIFEEAYLRAIINMKILRFETLLEKKIILLPGSEFKIMRISIVPDLGGVGDILKVVLKFTGHINRPRLEIEDS